MYRYGSCSTRVRLYRKWWLARFRRRVYGHTCSHTAVCTTHWVSRRWPRCLRSTRVLFTPSSVRWSSMKNSWYVGLPFSHLEIDLHVNSKFQYVVQSVCNKICFLLKIQNISFLPQMVFNEIFCKYNWALLKKQTIKFI